MAAPNNTAPNRGLIASIANNLIFKLVLVLSVLGSLLLLVYVKGETAGGKASKPEVTVHLTPYGKQLLKLQEPKRLQSQYRGDPQLIAALTSGATRPLALATTDFNRDAAPDLVSGYAFGQRGVITVQRGNVDAFVPQKQEIFNNAAKGILPPSFVSSADVLDLPDAPDFIATGDFNADGYVDLLTAARGGSALHMLAGNGEGRFAPAQHVTLEATITALTFGAFSHPRGTTMSVIVAVNGNGGPSARVFTASADKVFGEAVVTYPLPAAATAVQIGLLDEDPYYDLAVGAGEEMVIVHGHQIPKPGQEVSFDAQSRLETVKLSQPASDVVIGNFIADRNGRAEIAVLSNDGNIRFLQRGQLEPEDSLTVAPAAAPESRAEMRKRQFDYLKAKARVPVWQPGQEQWIKSEVPQINVAQPGATTQITRMPSAADDLLLLDQSNGQVKVVDAQAETPVQLAPGAVSPKGVIPALTVDTRATAVLSMPQKLNGSRDYVVLAEGDYQSIIIPDEVGTTFTVNTTTDLLRSPIANQCNGAAGDCSLREAVIKANTIAAPFAGPGHLINVPSGTYNLSLANPNTPSTTGTAGLNDLQIGSNVNKNTTLMGTGVTKPIINQTIAANDVITTGFTGNPGTMADPFAFLATVALSLQNLDVRGGTFTGIFVGVDNASGVSTSLINNCNVQNNTANNGGFGQGGGIQSATGHLTVTNSTFSSNIAPHADFGQGGAIAFIVLNPSGQGSAGNLLVDNCTFTGNSANVKNDFPAGGAISIGIARAANTSSVTDSTFTTNAAGGGGDGGAIANFSNNTLVANRNRFRGNTVTATGVGTGLHNQGSGPVNGENNWWGCDAFPTAAPCDTATNANVLFPVDSDPRIDLKLTANPTTICRAPATSTITADVTQNTNNATVNGGNAPDVLVGLNFTFANGPLGTVTAPLVVAIPVGGTVARTFNAPAVHGTAMPTVLLDVGTPQGVNILIPDSFTSAQTGNFDVATTWTPQCVPQSDDSVTIASPHVVSLPAGDDIADVTINPGGTLNTSTFNLNVNSTNSLKNYAVVNTWNSSGTLSGTGTITFTGGAGVTQTIAGTTTFHNLTLAGSATQAFGASSNSIANVFTVSTGTMNGGTSTFTFTGNPSSIAGANAKSFFNLVINAGATTTHSAGGNITINNNFTNGGTFTQTSTLTTTFAGTTHALAGAGTTTFGIVTINAGNTVNAGSHNFTFVGTPFTITGTFNGNTGTVTAGGSAAQSIAGAGTKAFNNLVINNASGVTLGSAASVGGTLFLTSGNFANGAFLTILNGATISRSSGTLGAAPTFTTSANVIYTVPSPAAAITTGVELPTSTTVLNNLTINNPSNVNLNANATVNGTLALTSGAFNVGMNTLTLNNGTSVGTGTLTSALTGTVNYNQVAGGQSVLAADYGNLTFSNGTKVLAPSGTIGVANVFTPVAGAHTITGSTFNFNGSGAQTVPAFNYNNLTISGARGANNVTFAGAGTIGIAGIFNPAASFAGGAYVLTNSTIDYNGTGAQDVIAFDYHNLTISGARGTNNVTLANSGTIGIAGAFLTPATFAGGAYVVTGSTVNYKGAGAQTMPVTFTTYNNLNINNPVGVAGTAATTVNILGNWVNNGVFTANGNTVNFNGTGSQTISGTAATTFSGLTVSNSTGLAMSNDNAVNAVLALTSGDITVAATKILTMPASGTSSGGFDVIGSVKRTGFVSGGSALSFGNPFNTIKIDSGTAPTDIVVNLTKAAPAGFPSAVLRTYGITVNGGTPNATVRLHYLDGELNGNAEGQLDLWRFNGSVFVDEQQSARNATDNWVEKNNITTFSDWTLAAHVNQAPSVTNATTVVNAQTTSGLVITANAIDGALVTHFKITNITNGTLYKNDGSTAISNNDFITLAEGNAGLKFTPALNSIATGSFNVQASSDATGTGLSATTAATITVNQGTTTTTITLDSPDPSTVGQVVTVNYTVVANLPSTGTPSGNVVVTVNDASGDTCSSTVAVGTCALTLTTTGSKTLTATYSGDSLFIGDDDDELHDVVGAPDAVNDAYSTFKNTPLNIGAPGVLGNDTGSPSVSAVGGCADLIAPFENCATTAGGEVDVNADGSFSYTAPSAVFLGADSFTYTATNGGGSDTATVNITVADSFFINEVLFNPTGTNAPNEYIEFRGPASATIPAGTYLVAIEGDTAENPGDVQTIINLSGLTFGSNGYLVLLQMSNTYVPAAGANVLTSTTVGFGGLPGAIWSADGGATDIEHDSVSFMLIRTATVPTLTDDIDANDDATADGGVFGGWTVIDSIGALDGSSASDAGYGVLTYALGGSGQVDPPNTMAVVGFAAVYVGRQGDSTGSTAASDWVATGTLGGAVPNWTVGANPEPPGFANKPLNHIGSTNFELVAPTVQSIVRASANPTNASSVDFTVTFSESVTGVDATDFDLTTTGTIAGASIGLIGAAGNIYTVTVNTGTGDGTIRLDLDDDDSIVDNSANPLGGAGAQDFTTGQVYTVDKSGPTVTINQAGGQADPTSISPINFTVVFNEAVTNFATGDVTLSGAGATTGTVTETAPNDGTTYNVAVTGMNASGNVTASLLAGVASDALGNLSQASSSTDNTVTFNFVTNNAPVLDNTGNMSLTGVNEDVPNASNAGTLVGDIILSAGGDRITDADAGAVEGVAVTAVDNTNGAWEFSINSGVNWTAFGTPSGAAARLLAANASTRIRFVPNANFHGTVATGITFRAWDQSSGTNGNTADTSTNGGSTAFSTATETASIVVAPVADTPSVTNASTNEDVQTSSGLVITRNAADGVEVTHFKITGITNGTLFLNDGTTSIANNAFITFAQGNAGLRFTPAANSVAAGSFTVQAATGSIDATLGGSTATATITVTAVNDAPSFQIASNPPAVAESAGAQTVNSFATNFLPGPVSATDEAGQTLVGYAVTSTGTTGTLAFTSGPSIDNAGTLTYTATNGTSGTATFNVVATDSGSGTPPNVNQSAPVAFTITVNSANDAPVLDNTGNMSLTSINEDVPNASNPGTLVADIILSAGGDRITDTDPGAVEGIAVIAVDNTNGTWEFSIDNGGVWTAFGSPSATTARLLAANATTRIRFVPNANFNGTVATGLTFRAWDQTSGTNGNTADPSTNGGATAFSTATETASITVNSSNDAPTLDAIGDLAINEDAAQQTVNLTGIGAGGGESQTLVITATSGNTGLIPNPTVTYTSPNATGSIAFTPVGNQSGTALITVTVNDGGGTANGGVETVVRTFTVTVNAVNDGPVNSVPSAQSVPKNGTLTFSAANSNLISVADIDAGTLQVTLTATNGTVSLSGVAGLSFTVGDGTADATMTFTGTIAAINAALSGMTFTPTAGYTGAASVEITTNDQGSTGSGGALSDTDTVNITVTQPQEIEFSAATFNINEGASNTPEGFASLTVTVNRLGDTSGAATVRYATHEPAGTSAIDCNVNNSGNASQRCDYLMLSGVLRFAAGDTSKTFQIPIINDVYVEPNETFTIDLTNPTGASLGSINLTTVTIADNDTTPPTGAQNPYLNNSFFVRMHYLDFLEREPDAAGFADWVSVLNNCNPNQGFLGAPVGCDRAHVSKGFFGSTEFIDRGFLVYRLYDVGLARLPDYATEYNPDSAQLRGFGLTALQIQQNLDNYLLELGARTEFVNRYASMAGNNTTEATQLIQLLETTAGVTLPASPAVVVGPPQYGRADLIDKRATNQFTVVQTVKAFVEQKVVYDKEFPGGFVTMQYFNYLRRNPDMAGRADWLDVILNGRPAQGIAPGDYRHLIFGFIYSTEYRQRFGTP